MKKRNRVIGEINPYLEIETSAGLVGVWQLNNLGKLGNIVSDELMHSNHFKFYSLNKEEVGRIRNHFSSERGYASKLEEANSGYNLMISRRVA